MQRAGWRESNDVHLDVRWSGGNPSEIRKAVAEIVASQPDVILSTGASTTGPLLQATHSLVIVFVLVPDPVGAGFVESLARPGGNATGFTVFEYGFSVKWLELLKQIAPRVTRAAVVRDPTITAGVGEFAAIQGSAPDAFRSIATQVHRAFSAA